MLRPRIIPCLLIHQRGLVKTKFFKDPIYIGDPINAVRIFNEKEADELIVFDIDATSKGVEPDFELIAKLAAECRMPLCYGGGVTTVEQVARIVDIGVEKVAISAAAIANPMLLAEIAAEVGRQSVVAVLDVRKSIGPLAGSYEICTHNAKIAHKLNPVTLAKQLQDTGAGEIIINSVDRDGQMLGYDIDLAMKVKQELSVPVTFLGGAGSLDHISNLINCLGVVGVAAGSLFVFKGKFNAVLISYPTPAQKKEICKSSLIIQ